MYIILFFVIVHTSHMVIAMKKKKIFKQIQWPVNFDPTGASFENFDTRKIGRRIRGWNVRNTKTFVKKCNKLNNLRKVGKGWVRLGRDCRKWGRGVAKRKNCNAKMHLKQKLGNFCQFYFMRIKWDGVAKPKKIILKNVK